MEKKNIYILIINFEFIFIYNENLKGLKINI